MREKLFEEAITSGMDDIQINETKVTTTSLILFNDQLDRFETDTDCIFLIKGHYQGKIGKVLTNYLDDTNIDDIISDLMENALNNENVEEDVFENGENNVDEKVAYPSVNFIKWRKQIENLAKTDCYAKQFYLTETSKEEKIINSLGKNSYSNSHMVNFDIEFTVIEGDESSVGVASFFGTIDDFDLDALYNETKSAALLKLEYSPIVSQKYSIILSSKMVSSILDGFITSFTYENVRNGMSFLKDCEKTPIMSNKITIIEDPTDSRLGGYRLFDDDGVNTYRKEVVKDGILMTYLLNKKNAKLLNSPSTGNAFVGVPCRNLFIEKGTLSEEELLCDLGDGVYIDTLVGLHVGLNQTSGEIALQAEGYLIENGKKKAGLKQFVMATSFQELFQNVRKIGSDLTFYGEAIGSPSISFDGITLTFKDE